MGECVQGDLAFMFSKNDFKYIVLCVDIFSGKIFTRAIKDKSAESVTKALRSIFNEFKTPIQKFETDRYLAIHFIIPTPTSLQYIF